jgi:hypothetical protein
MPNSKLFWLAKKPAITLSAGSALCTSAQAPNSGLAFVDNSQGASAAVAELADKLDFALDQLDLESQYFVTSIEQKTVDTPPTDELSDQILQQLNQLNSKAAEYTNSRVPAGIGAKWAWYELSIVLTCLTFADRDWLSHGGRTPVSRMELL